MPILGTNIAYSGIVAGMAKVDNPNVDGLTIYSGAADVLTGLFGGTPVEITLSSTAAAPHPIAAGILLMIAMALILFARLVPKWQDISLPPLSPDFCLFWGLWLVFPCLPLQVSAERILPTL